MKRWSTPLARSRLLLHVEVVAREPPRAHRREPLRGVARASPPRGRGRSSRTRRRPRLGEYASTEPACARSSSSARLASSAAWCAHRAAVPDENARRHSGKNPRTSSGSASARARRSRRVDHLRAVEPAVRTRAARGLVGVVDSSWCCAAREHDRRGRRPCSRRCVSAQCAAGSRRPASRSRRLATARRAPRRRPRASARPRRCRASWRRCKRAAALKSTRPASVYGSSSASVRVAAAAAPRDAVPAPSTAARPDLELEQARAAHPGGGTTRNQPPRPGQVAAGVAAGAAGVAAAAPRRAARPSRRRCAARPGRGRPARAARRRAPRRRGRAPHEQRLGSSACRR